MENGNWEIFFFLIYFVPRILVFLENQNRRNFFFSFFLSENSRFVENGNWEIFFFFFVFSIQEFSFCGKRELENFFFFFYPRIFVL